MDQVIYNNDTRYPGPAAHPPPEYIHGIPTRAELDAYPRMFTWGELKEIVRECMTTQMSLAEAGTLRRLGHEGWS